MSRDLPHALSTAAESTVTSQERVSSPPKTQLLTVLPTARSTPEARLTRGQVATRLGVSVSTVRRFEGQRLHPTVDDKDVRWFEEKEVAALAAQLANESGATQSRAAAPAKARAE